jgi:hypothetical protein
MADLSLTMTMLNGFMNGARTQSQSEILQWFLRMIVLGKDRDGADLCESGSIAVYRPDNKLHLFNDGDFLFEEGVLDRSKFKKTEFATYEGMMGRAFSQKTIQYSPDVKRDPGFINEGEPIKTMLCAPIILPSHRGRPFGVASFHNGPGSPDFPREIRTAMEFAVNCLSFALDLAARMPTNNVFIVHGRDTAALNSLKLLLVERGVNPTILGEQSASGAEMLKQLEDLLAECYAGFVLLTPDDEGRLINDPPPHKPRARQNVIFEGGWLSALFRRDQRICFLRTGTLELPSDILGVRCEDFDPAHPDVFRIEKLLTTWGISWNRPGAQ